MAKKIDMSRVKNFLFLYGERVALGLCLGTAVLLIVLGLWSASGAGNASNGKPWADALKDASNGLQSKIAQGLSDTEIGVKPIILKDWEAIPSNHQPSPYVNLGEDADTKRRNPKVLSVLFDPQDPEKNKELFQLDYLDRGSVGYEVDLRKQQVTGVGAGTGAGGAPGFPGAVQAPPMGSGMAGAPGAGTPLAQLLKPKREVVVSGVFPMKQQLEEFRVAGRFGSLQEVLALGYLPRVNGINVIRLEKLPDGKVKTTNLIMHDPKKDRLEIAQSLNDVMREAIYDVQNPTALATVIHPGLVTPLPILPEGKTYPKLTVKTENWPDAAPVDVAGNPMIPGVPMFGGDLPMPMGGPPAGIAMPMGQAGFPGGQQAPGAAAGNEVQVSFKQLLKEQRKDLVDRFKGDYNIFHPFGQKAVQPVAGKQAGPNMMTPPPMAGGPPGMDGAAGQPSGAFGWDALGGAGMGGAPGMVPPGAQPPMQVDGEGNMGVGQPGMAQPGQAMAVYDALVRFVDVDVEPGKTYSYAIQVRMQNPNYGKKTEVAEQALADVKELYSSWAQTPEITIPDEYHLYAVDQYQVDKLGDKSGKVDQPKPDQAVLQVHRWVERTADGKLVADWAIAERLLVRKGEQIGHHDQLIEMPTWNKLKGGFELLGAVPQAGRKQPASGSNGVPIDLVPKVAGPDGKSKSPSPPYLIDFEGGKKIYRGSAGVVNDESALDVLILTPEGRLIVRNARADGDTGNADEEVGKQARTRQERVENWRQRVRTYQGGGVPGGPAMPGGPAFPGAPGFPGVQQPGGA